MEILNSSPLKGCYELLQWRSFDERGMFSKSFHADSFQNLGLETSFVEDFYSTSHRGVLRGMHFQTPPYDHSKLVYCISGEVMDVVVDLRLDSPTYGQWDVFTLDSDTGNMLYVPRGMAHGFFVLSEVATVMYKVTTVYTPSNDCGIRWDSIGIAWPTREPIVSLRDKSFGSISDFRSPFRMHGGRV